jgi:hypothetical protein
MKKIKIPKVQQSVPMPFNMKYVLHYFPNTVQNIKFLIPPNNAVIECKAFAKKHKISVSYPKQAKNSHLYFRRQFNQN